MPDGCTYCSNIFGRGNQVPKVCFDVIFDDRSESPGVKLIDADLIGVPLRLLISKRTLEEQSVEFKPRDEKAARLIGFDNILDVVNDFYDQIDS